MEVGDENGANGASEESCDEDAIALARPLPKRDVRSGESLIVVEHPESGRPPRGPRILIVEDDAECRSAVKDALEESLFVVTEAKNGQVALEHMAQGLHPALVILDLQMPVMSGVELLQIMDGYDRLSRLPVLVMSGTARSDFAVGGAVKGFIEKPLDMLELLDAVHACVGPAGAAS